MRHSLSFVFATFAFAVLAGQAVRGPSARFGIRHQIRGNPSPLVSRGVSGQEQSLSTTQTTQTSSSTTVSAVYQKQEMTTITKQFSQSISTQTSSVSMTQIGSQFTQCTEKFQSYTSQFTSVTTDWSKLPGGISDYESCVTEFLRVVYTYFNYIQEKFTFQKFSQHYESSCSTFKQTLHKYTSKCKKQGVDVPRCASKAGMDKTWLKKFQLGDAIAGVVDAVENVVNSVTKPVTGLLGGLLGGQ